MASYDDPKIPPLTKPLEASEHERECTEVTTQNVPSGGNGRDWKVSGQTQPFASSVLTSMVNSEAKGDVTHTSLAPPPTEPTIQQSWDALTKTIDTRDDELMKGYKEDIDTLLVFAGLFSAIVTAFTIESSKRLEEDLQNTTVVLLRQLAHRQMSGLSSPPPAPFTPNPSDVRINTVWFLSLILALVYALFGLLCKQWVREHQRQTNTRTPGQALALHWLRNQSFARWHVPKILASLPILLEVALFLFFAGLLELLWNRHHVPFAIALAVVGFAVICYLTTTILPGLHIIRQVFQTHPYFTEDNPVFYPRDIGRLPPIDLICPYKSPQSWLIFRLFPVVYHFPGFKPLLYSLLIKFNGYWDKDKDIDDLDYTITKNILNLSHWPSLDLHIIQRFSSMERCPDLYELKGFRWLVQETRDIPSMIPHLKNVLGELPLHLVMPAIFDKWESPAGKSTWSIGDLNSALESPPTRGSKNNLFDDQTSPDDLSLSSQILCFRHLLETHDHYWLAEAAERIWDRILNDRKSLNDRIQ
ncbi:hypothetical protein E1B28_003602 [Marasmius oreades]|uniref:DUF6535 domain-containing protein n=1 Tax=Marasmius oreades TaxID=181124 RepID=A0A9P7UK36_9AGAR|nr:uncharacterized protein E1B28_003602 [Marasmius oreades]KAG7086087.1 hypothetical protein E1B28_003602 [Marasmius oreades]